jgi:hypothetical protein
MWVFIDRTRMRCRLCGESTWRGVDPEESTSAERAQGKREAYDAALKAVGMEAAAQAVAYRGASEEEILGMFADVAKNMRRLAERGPVCLSFEPSVVVADRIKALERERDVALAWVAWYKALHERALEDEVDRDDAGINAAIDGAEEALLQLGINPNEDEP